MSAARWMALGVTAIALAVALAFASVPAAWAATKTEAPASAKPISSKELQAFAQAAREVFRIRQAFAPKVQSAQSEIDARDFIVSAEKAMGDAIGREGLTVARYNAILKAAQQDPALAARIQTLVDKAAAGK
jgi:Domain of unknown function (DUF4168)